MSRKKTSGFSLLELLIVIGIIAVLIGVGVVSYSTAQRKSRDSKKKSDLQSIQNALEQYYSVCGFEYPDPVSNAVPTIGCASPATIIMSEIPLDPKTGTDYVMTGGGTTYTVCVPTPAFESESDTTYCVSSRQ
jgi:prepilin-type N-terminal cleavage/methylation domain-containing protein